MTFPYISKNIYDCPLCPRPCDGKSKGVYNFEDDVQLSEQYEYKIINYINSKGTYEAVKTETAGYPDIEVYTAEKEIKAYIEIKVQQRTFMAIAKYLPEADLCPSETIALNLSDLKRYFDLFEDTGRPIYLVWVLLHRSCILQPAHYKIYAQKIEVLRDIYQNYRDKRRFRRNSGIGDVVGDEHKGVVVNYHFSLNELKEWDIRV